MLWATCCVGAIALAYMTGGVIYAYALARKDVPLMRMCAVGFLTFAMTVIFVASSALFYAVGDVSGSLTTEFWLGLILTLLLSPLYLWYAIVLLKLAGDLAYAEQLRAAKLPPAVLPVKGEPPAWRRACVAATVTMLVAMCVVSLTVTSVRLDSHSFLQLIG